MKSFLILATATVLTLLIYCTSPAGASHVKLKVDDEFGDTFEEKLVFKVKSPTDVQISPDGSMMLVTSKEGELWAINNFEEEDPEPKLVLHIKKLCTNIERGLSGAAFHPNFDENRWFYIYYTYDKYNDCDSSGSVNRGPINRLSRLTMRADGTADLDDEDVFFDTPIMPYGAHNSGNIAFGADGMLYVSVGDGSGGISKTNDDGILYPQATDMLLGKILRLTDTGEIPDDNPYANGRSERCHKTGWTASGPKYKCKEIFAYGLRNPFRFAMDPNAGPTTTRIFLNDVGRHTWESIRECGDGFAGANYGYPEREGPCRKKEDTNCKPPKDSLNFIDPVHWFHHDEEDGGAITGGAFYPNDMGWPASFRDSYLYANYAFGGIYRIKKNVGSGCPWPQCDPPISDYFASTQVLSSLRRVVSLKFGPYKGTTVLYAATRGDTGNRGDHAIYRISFTGFNNKDPRARIETLSPTIGFPPMVVEFDGTESSDPDGRPLTYEWDFDGDGITDSFSTSPGASYEYKTPGTYYATLTVRDPMGGQDSAEVRIDVDKHAPPRPMIKSPEEGTTFAVGDVLKLRGSANDIEGDKAVLTWEVRLHHDDHFHQIMAPRKGKRLKIVAPEPISFEAVTSSHLVILLTATDSSGISSTTSMIVRPKLVEITIDSEPSGLYVNTNSERILTPALVTTWANHAFEVTAPSQITADASYGFQEWSDGGRDKSHVYIASETDPAPKLVAKFVMITPQVQIDSPTVGSTFAVGDIFVLSGSATTGVGSNAVLLPESSLTWEVRLSNGSHYQVFLPPTVGNNVVLEGAPAPMSFDSASKDTYLEVLLTAKSSLGLSTTERVNIYPKKVDIVFQTKPSGLYIIVDGEITQTPVTVTTWEKHHFEIEAPSQKMGNKTVSTYVWTSWSDGGSQSHKYVALKERNGLPHTVVADFIPLVNETPQASSSSTTQMPGWVFGVFIAAGIVLALVFAARRRRRAERKEVARREGEAPPHDETKNSRYGVGLYGPRDSFDTGDSSDEDVRHFDPYGPSHKGPVNAKCFGTEDMQQVDPYFPASMGLVDTGKMSEEKPISATSLVVGLYGEEHGV